MTFAPFVFPRRHRRAPFVAVGYGAGIFVWLSLEDQHVLPVTLISAGAALLIAYFTLTRRYGGMSVAPRDLLIGAALIGAGIGAGTALVAALLMVWKTGMHAHPFPDYPPALILDLLRRAPTWALAGACAACALALLTFVRKR